MSYHGKGGTDFQNAAAPIVAEYNERVHLAKAGFTSDINSLSSFKANAFLICSDEIRRQDEIQSKIKGKKGK